MKLYEYFIRYEILGIHPFENGEIETGFTATDALDRFKAKHKTDGVNQSLKILSISKV